MHQLIPVWQIEFNQILSFFFSPDITPLVQELPALVQMESYHDLSGVKQVVVNVMAPTSMCLSPCYAMCQYFREVTDIIRGHGFPFWGVSMVTSFFGSVQMYKALFSVVGSPGSITQLVLYLRDVSSQVQHRNMTDLRSAVLTPQVYQNRGNIQIPLTSDQSSDLLRPNSGKKYFLP